MAIKSFGGGGGGGSGGWVPSLHTEELDTIAHWPFDSGVRTDNVGTYDIDTGNWGFGSAGDSTSNCFTTSGNAYDNTASTPLNPNLNTNKGYTFATALYSPSFPTGSTDIVRYEKTAATQTAYRVGVVQSTGVLYIGRDTSAGYQQYSTTATLTQDEWLHFAWVQNDDGLGGSFYINGALAEAWSTANTANNTGTASRFILGASWNAVGYFSYYSTIVREKACTAEEVLAMASQTGFV